MNENELQAANNTDYKINQDLAGFEQDWLTAGKETGQAYGKMLLSMYMEADEAGWDTVKFEEEYKERSRNFIIEKTFNGQVDEGDENTADLRSSWAYWANQIFTQQDRFLDMIRDAGEVNYDLGLQVSAGGKNAMTRGFGRTLSVVKDNWAGNDLEKKDALVSHTQARYEQLGYAQAAIDSIHDKQTAMGKHDEVVQGLEGLMQRAANDNEALDRIWKLSA
tara:strand:- start:948 stop:1610 length:663 start_codon:yes stop_codon:yes gene_type:complete